MPKKGTGVKDGVVTLEPHSYNIVRFYTCLLYTSHIGVLDGIRAIAIFLVAWYHIWQQSWLQPLTEHVNLDGLVRNGSILVDMMILLSGFCLFLPYARDLSLIHIWRKQRRNLHVWIPVS